MAARCLMSGEVAEASLALGLLPPPPPPSPPGAAAGASRERGGIGTIF
jgi:hypothetical protein